MAITRVSGDEALADFRARLSPDLAFDLLRAAGGRLLVALPVGAGKSHWLQNIVRHVAKGETYDLVAVLAPRWDVLLEHAQRLKDCAPFIVRPRPRTRCGTLDPEWQEHELAGCALLGRAVLCARCPRARGCRWAADSLIPKDCKVVLATQQQLIVNPLFLAHLKRQAHAAKMLTLVDESDVLLKPTQSVVSRTQLERFAAVLGDLPPELRKPEWLEMTRLASAATSPGFRGTTVIRTSRLSPDGNGVSRQVTDRSASAYCPPWDAPANSTNFSAGAAAGSRACGATPGVGSARSGSSSNHADQWLKLSRTMIRVAGIMHSYWCRRGDARRCQVESASARRRTPPATHRTAGISLAAAQCVGSSAGSSRFRRYRI